MSRALIVFAHPNHDSFNFSLLEKAVEGLDNNRHEIQIDDLYAINFDPLMTGGELRKTCVPDQIIEEQAKVSWADTLFFIFPIWWWGPPAILKGWLERVLCQDFAFRYDVRLNRLVGMLDGRHAVVISTSSADPTTYELTWQAESQTGFVNAILVTCGIRVIKQMNFCNVHDYSLADDIESHLREVQEYAQSI